MRIERLFVFVLGKDLFTYHREEELKRNAPLAERMRPRNLDEFVGQSAILAQGRLLRRAIAADRVGNLLLHGPPGVGKTTLARIIAANTRSHFTILNAVLAGVKDLREEVEAAKSRLERHSLRTILFIDEVHRFNRAQQDALLPWVENGTLMFIGATTENPCFEVNKALLSRSRLFRLQHLSSEDLHRLLSRALQDNEFGYGVKDIKMSYEARNHLVNVANGDARTLLNALELAVETTSSDEEGLINIDLSIAEESIQERAVLYDKQGDAHFDTISAFIKSLRGSDGDAALFWLARMIEAGESPQFIFRRMLISASEDIGLADPQAIVVVEACAAAFERIGLPEGLYHLAQAALYLSSTEKSNSLTGFFEAQRHVREFQQHEVPSHLRDSHRDSIAFGDGKGYRYPHAFTEHWVAQQYLPEALQGQVFWQPGDQGWEGQRRLKILDRRTAQLAAAAESAEENPLLVTYSPENPLLESWKERQITCDGDRLKKLEERLWLGVNWQRHHRVLVVGGRSLVWTLTPLSSVPEGLVMFLSNSDQEIARLSSQVDFLDPIQRPVFTRHDLLNTLPKDLSFEWIGGRINLNDIKLVNYLESWQQITRRASHKSGLRLLISHPTLGPAMAISEISTSLELSAPENEVLGELIDIETRWLDVKREKNLLNKGLSELGWSLESEEWNEDLSLLIDESLENRWLSEGSNYLESIKKLSEEKIGILRVILKRLRGKKLPQKLSHQKVVGILT